MSSVSPRRHRRREEVRGAPVAARWRSPALAGETTFDRLAEVVDAFTEAKGLERFSVYVFDFGAPVGFRLATSHPERIAALVIQNGNAYEEGLGAKMQGLKPYWADRAANESAIRAPLELSATRSQYVEGVPDPATVNPDLWELDQRYMELPGRDRVMLDLLFDYHSNVALYPSWHEYLRTHEPPALLAWGTNDAFLPEAGAQAYLRDLPEAELHLLDRGVPGTRPRGRRSPRCASPSRSDRCGQFLVPVMPERVLYAEPLRRRVRAELACGTSIPSELCRS